MLFVDSERISVISTVFASKSCIDSHRLSFLSPLFDHHLASGIRPPGGAQIAALMASPEGQAMMSDPVMAPVLRDMQSGGPMAAMRHMSNPAVMSKIMAIMGQKK